MPENDQQSRSRNSRLPNAGIFNHFNLSPYAYCNNNPVVYHDPDGKMALAIAIPAGAGIAAGIAAAILLSILAYVTIDKITDYAKQNIRENGFKELHHAFPMFLGGPRSQTLVPIERGRHKQLHRDLYVFLDTFYKRMKPNKINPGFRIRRNFSPEHRKEAMARFYLVNIDQYADAAAQFFIDHPEMLTEENIKWAIDHAFESRFWQIVRGWISEETPE